jgi:hypothetical protein
MNKVRKLKTEKNTIWTEMWRKEMNQNEEM